MATRQSPTRKVFTVLSATMLAALLSSAPQASAAEHVFQLPEAEGTDRAKVVLSGPWGSELLAEGNSKTHTAPPSPPNLLVKEASFDTTKPGDFPCRVPRAAGSKS